MNTNAEWQDAAISNLISQGVPPDQASVAIQAYLNAQQLSPAMAASRDLAIDSIGPPPQVPQPAQQHAPGTTGGTFSQPYRFHPGAQPYRFHPNSQRRATDEPYDGGTPGQAGAAARPGGPASTPLPPGPENPRGPRGR